MPKQNITLSIDRDLIRQARQLSARKSTSVSKLLSDELEDCFGITNNMSRPNEVPWPR